MEKCATDSGFDNSRNNFSTTLPDGNPLAGSHKKSFLNNSLQNIISRFVFCLGTLIN